MGTRGGSARTIRTLLLTLLIVVASFVLLLRMAYEPPSVAPKMSLDEVYRLAARGQIRQAEILDEDAILIGYRCTESRSSALTGSGVAGGLPSVAEDVEPCEPPVSKFQASYPRSDVSTAQLIERMTATGTIVLVDKQTGTAVMKLILTFLFPVLILANLFGIIFVARGGDTSMADIAGFSKIGKRSGKKRKFGRKKDKEEERPSTGVTFANVGGVEEAVTELREVTDYLKDPKKYEAYGASVPKGVLLFGPPGCGKTLLARAVAGEAGVPFFPVSGAEFIESLVGVGAARVRDLFRQVREVAPAIVFIDEIDAVGRKRSGEGSTGGEREQTVNQLLVELDGFDVTAGIVLMGATNRPDILDPALLRPGRFDRHVTLQTPDLHGRQEILELHAKGKPISPDVDFASLARRTPGFTGADLANVINEGALLAIREGGEEIEARHLSEAIQRVLHGPQRRGKLMSAEERKRLAYHESGHALVAASLGQAGGVQRVSIVARGMGLGSSSISHEADRVLLTESEMKAALTIAMGGIAAERLAFAEVSTSGEDDLERANALAREMVGVHGMSADTGPLRILTREGGFLTSDAQIVQAISGQSLAAFDEEVKVLIRQAEEQAAELLLANREHLDGLAEALETEETLEGAPLERHLSRVVPPLGGLPVASDGRSGTRPARTGK